MEGTRTISFTGMSSILLFYWLLLFWDLPLPNM